MKKKYLLLLLLLLLVPFKVYAEEAKDLTKSSSYTLNENTKITKLSDDNFKTNISIKKDEPLKISSDEKISHIYIVYELSSKSGVLTTDNEENELGKDGFLHEYVKLTIPSNSFTITYNEDAKISDIYVYGEGDIPKSVQVWKKEDKTDLMIFSTHADDEQLFFAGVMPTYINKGKKVHVVYLARHDVGAYYNPSRMHEQLNGLWTLGVTDYPTFGLIPDAYSESLDTARKIMNNAGFTDDDVIKFDVREIRKYQPKVILGHDVEGEYGHGQHRLNTDTLKQAIVKAQDGTYEVDGLSAYVIPKVYLHLYDPENQTVLDYDIPLENYDGKTAFQVSKEGYAKHLSQQYTWFTSWLNGKNNSYTSAKQIIKYNPAYWGLYFTTVGEDKNKNDLFENIPEKKEEEPEEHKKEEDKKENVEKKTESLFDRYKDKISYIAGGIILFCLLIIVILNLKKRNKKRK